jgi:signal transduction histidine kinase
VNEFVAVLAFLNLVLFVSLGLIAAAQWRRRRSLEARWIALAFSALGAVFVLARIVPDEPGGAGLRALQKLMVVALLLFPFLLYGFTSVFDRPSRRARIAVAALTVAMIAWTLALPRFPAPEDAYPWWFIAYLVGFLVHWLVLSSVVAVRLWEAGRGQPTVARRRMQALALGAGGITAAIFLIASRADPEAPSAIVGALLAAATGAALLFGLAPLQAVRAAWRRPEQKRLEVAIRGLMSLATTQEAVAARVIGPMSDIVGARALAIRNDEGRILAVRNELPSEPPTMTVVESGASLDVWTSPYAPYFGAAERALLASLAALTGIALDRARLFAQEREARLAVERANELKTNFVALAAHELRTPVTTIHGFVQTLNRLGSRLSDEQRAEIRATLEQQTTRMAHLVEQLLDLSRLDAHAIEIRPQSIEVRKQVTDVVAAAAGGRADEVVVDVDPGATAEVDTDAFDRILSNLVTNAFRYGVPPVNVTARRADGLLRVSVTDHGHGVPPEFVADLFERFARSGVANDRLPGTGLGLAIAKSYAEAHGGDLVYDATTDGGARFTVLLPAEDEPVRVV